MRANALERLLLEDPCGLFTFGLIVWVIGNCCSIGSEKVRKVGAALGGAALIAIFLFGMARHLEILNNILVSGGFAFLMVGSAWIVVSLLAFIIESLPRRREEPPAEPPPKESRPEPPPQEPSQPPPPQPTRSERAASARERYEEKLRTLEKAGLDDVELNAAREQAKQAYTRELDEILK